MLPEIGHFALILALVLALIQMALFCSGRWANIDNINIIRPLALGQVLFTQLSFAVLSLCFAFDDFSVQYVANNSNSSLPIYYKLTAVWGAHEGSLLLWITILSLWSLAVALKSRKWPLPFSNKILAVLGYINLGLLILILKSSKPLFLVCIIPEFFTPFGFEIVPEYPEAMQEKLNYCTSELVVPETYVVMKFVGNEA